MNLFIPILALPTAALAEALETLEKEEGFGFNTNIFETNIVNLAAVLGIVVFFVGKNLTALLETRQQTILNNLREADLRASEAQEKLNKARLEASIAEKKAKEIRSEANAKAQVEKNLLLNSYQMDLARLEQYKQETLGFFKEKALREVYVSLVSLALNRVKEKFSKPLDDQFHMTVNNSFIARFAAYNRVV
uniref:ATP synthase subunit b, chloroplastic n=1 Tax=Floydiella terrestris TaxID=51328 RepID=E2DSH4_FLOTE|nr:CF0 subunit I of ATP synthase [Floydiella terrestris]ACZ58433.1 CF0 subunit I of ATP synthase [Floydiella terrestris]